MIRLSRCGLRSGFLLSMPIFVSDTPLSPMGPSSPSQEGLFTDLRLLSLEKQLNIELKVHIVREKMKHKKDRYSDPY